MPTLLFGSYSPQFSPDLARVVDELTEELDDEDTDDALYLASGLCTQGRIVRRPMQKDERGYPSSICQPSGRLHYQKALP